MTDRLRDLLQAEADDSGRALSAEITARLEISMSFAERLISPDVRRLLHDIAVELMLGLREYLESGEEDGDAALLKNPRHHRNAAFRVLMKLLAKGPYPTAADRANALNYILEALREYERMGSIELEKVTC